MDLWRKRTAQAVKPTDAELKALYDGSKDLKVAAQYNLRRIVLKDEVLADDLLNQLNKEKVIANRSTEFAKLAQTNSLDKRTASQGGLIGWVDSGKLSPKTVQLLKDQPAGSVVKIAGAKGIWEILLIGEIKGERVPSFEETKPFLINVLQKQAINKEAKKIMDTLNTPSKETTKQK